MKQKLLDLINFAISSEVNSMTFSKEEIKEIKKELDQIEDLKEENKQMQHNMRKDAELKEVVREDSKFIFNEWCKYKKVIEIFKKMKEKYDEHGQGYFNIIDYENGVFELFIDSRCEVFKEEADLIEEVLENA